MEISTIIAFVLGWGVEKFFDYILKKHVLMFQHIQTSLLLQKDFHFSVLTKSK